MTTIDLRLTIGNLTQREFSEMFNISLRTVQNWDCRNCMPKYVYDLILEVHQLRVYNRILKNQLH